MPLTSTTLLLHSGRSYQLELNGAVAERFKSRHSTPAMFQSRSDLLDVMIVELPNSFSADDDPNALPYEPQLGVIRVGTSGGGEEVGQGFAALFGNKDRPPGNGRYSALYPFGLVHVATGEELLGP